MGTRLSLRPLSFMAQELIANLGRYAPREGGHIFNGIARLSVYAATTRGPGSTSSARWHGLLSIVTSEKPTALSWSHISVRASDPIDASGSTTARACDV